MKKRIILLLVVLAAGCARVVAPSGGPEDRDPPEIFLVEPEPGEVSAVPEKVLLEYSERIIVEPSMVEVYPGDAEITVHSRSIEIEPQEGSDVLTVTVSGLLQDTRGNQAVEPLKLVWNSVPAAEFASAALSVSRSGGGAVTGAARCDIYRLPQENSPLVTQYPDTAGTILAEWLPGGEYRFTCYEDLDRSRSWDPEREPGDQLYAPLTPGETVELSLEMTIVDSIGPVVASVEALDGWHLEILWNEQVKGDSEGSVVEILDPDGVPVPLYGIRSSSGRTSTGRLSLYTGQMSDTLYKVRIQGIEDLAGNPSLPDSLEFWGSDSLPGSPYALLSAYPEDGGTEVPPGGPFYISFTDWTDLNALDSLYRITRVFDMQDVEGTLSRISPYSFSFTPDEELLGEKQYRVDLDSGLVSLQGDTLSSAAWVFIPAWSDLPGSLSGVISGTGSGMVTLVVSPAGSQGEAYLLNTPSGEYILQEVIAGRYTVSCFVDRNSDGVWNPGEPYGAWPGVVEVFPGSSTPDVDVQVVP